MLSAEQMRAGRALLRWDQRRLAQEAGISVETVKRLEKMTGELLSTTGTTLSKIESAFSAAGIELIDITGAKLRS